MPLATGPGNAGSDTIGLTVEVGLATIGVGTQSVWNRCHGGREDCAKEQEDTFGQLGFLYFSIF